MITHLIQLGKVDGASSLNTTLTETDLQNVADRVWAHLMEGTYTAKQSMMIQNSAVGALVSGMDKDSPLFRDLTDTRNRLTVPSNKGNRLTITYDLT